MSVRAAGILRRSEPWPCGPGTERPRAEACNDGSSSGVRHGGRRRNRRLRRRVPPPSHGGHAPRPPGVGAALESPATRPNHHGRAPHGAGGRDRRRRALPRPRPRLARARITASSSAWRRSATISSSRWSCTGGAIPTADTSPTACSASPRRSRSVRRYRTPPGSLGALKLQGKPGVACTFIGDGATSEGDFYEGLNLAGVQHVPLLVVVLNNGWAISTPTSRQTAAPTFAAKAEAVGVPSARVDGNDVLAVVVAARAARACAVAGEGPQLLELITYRMGVHTNSDDPTRYVPPASSRPGENAIRSSSSARASPKPANGTTRPTRRSSTRSRPGSSASSTRRSNIPSTRTTRSTTSPPTTVRGWRVSAAS